mgnify:CR=1 FL=1
MKKHLTLIVSICIILFFACLYFIENNKNEITKSIDEELDEIENYTEQALFYARSNAVNKDYVVTKSNLKEIVNGAILKSKRALLSNYTI